MVTQGTENMLQNTRCRDTFRLVADRERLGEPVLVSEIQRELSMRASSAWHYVRFLANRDAVTVQGEGHARRVRLTERGRELAGFNLPDLPTRQFAPDPKQTMVRYPIPCGPLVEANEEPEYVSHPFISRLKGDYLATARGDSMFNPKLPNSIAEADEILMRPDVFPENGQIVHAQLKHDNGVRECTIKVFSLDERNGMVTLWPLNPAYLEIVLPIAEVEIMGVALQRVTTVGRYNRK